MTEPNADSPPPPTCLQKTQTTCSEWKTTIWQALYRKEPDGETYILDRNWKSWSKILVFYAIYYTFLGLLFWGTIALYQGVWIPEVKEGNAPRLSTRLGQPGLAVHPFNGMDPSYKGSSGMAKITIHPNDLEETVTKNYIETMEDFLGENSPINVPESVQDKEPVIALNLNKVIGWTPVNQGGAGQAPLDNTNFVRNSIVFSCTAIDQNGDPDDTLAHTVEFVGGKNYILPSKFPFQGCAYGESCSYEKPAVLLKLKNLSETDSNRYMCEALADNITKRMSADEDGSKSQNSNMAKVGVGFIQFSVDIN